MRLLCLVVVGCSTLVGCSSVVDPDPSMLGMGGMGSDGGMCGPGQIICEGICVSPADDLDHCGGCGNVCNGSCISGMCICPPGDPECGPVIGNPDDCGGRTCRNTEACIGGACTCRPGLTAVAGECVDLNNDGENCGAPGRDCGDALCAGGSCVERCGDRATRCEGGCVDLRRDPLNCGECGKRCDRDEVCSRGRCEQFEPAGCNRCPCDSCGGDLCCAYPGTAAPICLDADACPS